MRIGVLGTVVALAASTLGGTATATPDRIDLQLVQQAIDKLARNGAAGVQVRVTDGRRTFTARAGTAEWGTTRPVPLDGRFRAGSVTKVFVATVVLQLVGEREVDLDSPVERYLPGLLPDGGRITVRMLLQQTSGLHDYADDVPDDFEAIRFKRWTPQEMLALATAKPLDFPPGTAWKYSNTNYVVAGLLIEKVTGLPYARAVEQRITTPLRLRDTSVPGDRTGIPGPHAHAYRRIGDRVVDITRLNASVGQAAGEMISTTADLDRFLGAVARGDLLKPAQAAEMTTFTAVSPGYGLGLEHEVLPCGAEVIGHSGIIPGFSTLMIGSADGRTRLTASFTTSPDGGSGDGAQDLVSEVFCD